MKYIVRINISLTVFNLIVLLCFWYRYTSPVLSAVTSFSNSDFLAAQANHNAILQVHLVIFSILLAILGFFGYNEIKRTAERTAEEKAEKALNDLVPKLVREQIEKLGPERIAEMLVGLKMAAPLKKDEKELSDDVRIEEVLSGLEE